MLMILSAVGLDLILGDPCWFPHPVRGMGLFIRFFENRILPVGRHKKAMGLIMAIILCFISYTAIYGLLAWARQINLFFAHTLEIFLLWTCVSFKSLYVEVKKVWRALVEKDLEKARCRLSYLVSRDTASLTETGVIKAGIETAAENTSDGIIAPLFFICLGGAPLGFLYKAVNTMDSMVGYKNEKYQDFGFFPAKIDDLFNFIPARITGFCMVLWAFVTGKNYQRGFLVMKREHHKSASPNAGWPEAAMAGILGVSLLGDAVYFGKKVLKPSIGVQQHPMEPNHILEALRIMSGSVLIFLAGALLIEFVGKGLI